MVLIAIGIEPLINFIQASGIACGRGVKVDNYMQTSAQHIYAAGDVIETIDTITGRPRVLGQWYPAIEQARKAAYSMLGKFEAYTGAPQCSNYYNATFLYGLDFVSVGLTQIPANIQGSQEIVADPLPRNYRKIILHNGIALGILFLGDRRQAEVFNALDGFYVRDLDSSYGVFVNNVKINNPFHLSHGNQIVIGNTMIYFSYLMGETSATNTFQSTNTPTPTPEEDEKWERTTPHLNLPALKQPV